VVGIDLGTTNSAFAYAEIQADADPFAPANVQLLPVPQLVNPGEVREESLLPSFLYLPGASDFPAGTLALPWDGERDFVVGQLAQKRGVENVGRLVSSAKSWLSHSGVDRTAALLPFRAPEGVAKISPVEASRRYLEHLRQAWDAKMPDAPQVHPLDVVKAAAQKAEVDRLWAQAVLLKYFFCLRRLQVFEKAACRGHILARHDGGGKVDSML